jgi:hypothetical protein
MCFQLFQLFRISTTQPIHFHPKPRQSTNPPYLDLPYADCATYPTPKPLPYTIFQPTLYRLPQTDEAYKDTTESDRPALYQIAAYPTPSSYPIPHSSPIPHTAHPGFTLGRAPEHTHWKKDSPLKKASSQPRPLTTHQLLPTREFSAGPSQASLPYIPTDGLLVGCTPGRARGPLFIFRKIHLYGKTKKSTHGHQTAKPLRTHFPEPAEGLN